jgi:hypothetical protein
MRIYELSAIDEKLFSGPVADRVFRLSPSHAHSTAIFLLSSCGATLSYGIDCWQEGELIFGKRNPIS